MLRVAMFDMTHEHNTIFCGLMYSKLSKFCVDLFNYTIYVSVMSLHKRHHFLMFTLHL